MDENEIISTQILLYECEFFDQDLMEEIKSVVVEGKVCEYRDVSVKILFFGNIDYQDWDARHKTTNISMEYSGMVEKFLIYTKMK